MLSNKNNLFLSKITESINDLDEYLLDGFEKRVGLNDKTTLNKETKLLFVGTAVPPDLLYFYANKGNSIYKWIDDVRSTHLDALKTRISMASDQAKKLAYVNEIIDILLEEKIAFLDVANAFITKNGSRRDCDIVKFYFDKEDFKSIYDNSDLKIVALTTNAKNVLENYLGLSNILCVPIFENYSNKKEPIIDALMKTR